jgi:hypothetical protein
MIALERAETGVFHGEILSEAYLTVHPLFADSHYGRYARLRRSDHDSGNLSEGPQWPETSISRKGSELCLNLRTKLPPPRLPKAAPRSRI